MLNEPFGELFDPKTEWNVHEHFRPHWSQAGAIAFITFRTHDSIPKKVLTAWEREKQDWCARRGLSGTWRNEIELLDETQRREFTKEFNRQREEFLDEGLGECHLRQPELARIVFDSLLHFDDVRYQMGDFVIMPNHVHLLASFPSPEMMQKQCTSWLHFTAYRINKRLGRSGKFWQQEPFDHLVRSLEQYDYLRRYIENNPKKANLKEGEYAYRRRPSS